MYLIMFRMLKNFESEVVRDLPTDGLTDIGLCDFAHVNDVRGACELF